MKNIIITILLILLLWVNSASCQDFLVARILTVNHESLELTVVTEADPDTQIAVQFATENELPRNGELAFLPNCATPGETVRLWGNRKQSEDPLFIATDIRGCRYGRCSDPTGIRSRLRKIRRHQYTTESEGGEEGFDSPGYGNQSSRGNGEGSGGGNSGGGGNGGGNGGGGGGNR
jgi:uncharacterized membrane protein YgcG